MGSELVESSSTPHLSYTEQFYEVFPSYLAAGMTFDQFWNDDCDLVKYYRKAENIRADKRNQEAWLQGMYFYDALLCASPILHAFAKSGTEPHPYTKEPYPLTDKQASQKAEKKEKEQIQRAASNFEMYAAMLNSKMKKEVAQGGDNRGTST